MELTAGERAELEAVIAVGFDRSMASRARMILDYAAGSSVSEITASSGATRPTFYKWITRYEQGGIAGLDDLKSPGRPRIVTEEERARIIALTELPPPETTGLTHWSLHGMARYLKRHEGIDVSHTFISELWRENDLRPRQNGTPKAPEDPGFSVKAACIAGLYLNPPTGAIVLSFDMNEQFLAPERAQPVLPASLGKRENRTRGYLRREKTNLFTSLEALSAQVPSTYMPPERAAEMLNFMNEVSRSRPGEQEIHVLLDSTAARIGEDASARLAEYTNFTFHCTPPGGSWISQVENWFGILTRQAIGQGAFESLAKLINRIDEFVRHWSPSAGPFEWTAATGQMLEKAAIPNLDRREHVAGSQKLARVR